VPAEPGHLPHTRTSRFAWGAVVVILVGVTALLVYTLTDTPTTLRVVHRAETAPDTLLALAAVPITTFDAVGITAPEAGLTPPTAVTGQAPLYAAGKPEGLFGGAEEWPFLSAGGGALV